MEGLVHLLNAAPLALLPDAITTEQEYTALMAYLEPWIIGSPVEALRVATNPQPPVVDCHDPRYGDVFTGVQRHRPVDLVDFVPVGYDLDLLEVLRSALLALHCAWVVMTIIVALFALHC